MMVRVLAFVAMMAVAQPALAIQVVEVAAPAESACTPGSVDCTDGTAPEPAGQPADTIGPKTVIAAMVGVLVLGLSLGRRKSGLPEVVS